MGSFTGTSTTAPANVVDDAPSGSFTVQTATAGDLLRDDLTSSDGWTTYANSPTFTDGVLTGGAAYRDLGGAPGNIRFALSETITAGSSAGVFFCANAGFTQYYRLAVNEISWRLYKGASLLYTWANGGQADDAVEIRTVDGSPIEVYINGTRRLYDSDTAYRDNTYFMLQAAGDTGTITVDPAEGAVVVTP